jgi:hypothetical protein
MNLKKIALILLPMIMIMVMLGVSPRNAHAQGYSCDLLYPGMTLSAECDEIHFVLGWVAMTPGQINEFLNAMQWTFTLRDDSGNVLKIITPNQVASFWSPAYAIDPADLGVDCGMPRAWETDLMLPLGKLSAGNYTITLDENFRHPITDGFNACWIDGFKIPVTIYPTTYSFTGPFTVE